MSVTIKTSDLGWFYHAPARKKNTEPVIPPPISQIPGLSNEAYLPPEEPPKGRWIRETDSRYVRLAKEGGRPDLLCTVTPELPSTEPLGYPRCEWYYDNPTQGLDEHEDEERQPYQFMLPDYMVHQPSKPKIQRGVPVCPPAPSGVPYRNPVIHESDGSSGTDRTAKLQEPRKFGYGVRSEKHQAKPSSQPAESPKQRSSASGCTIKSRSKCR